MKKTFIITLIATLANFFSVSAQYSEDSPGDRIDSEGNTVHHWFFCTAQYQFSDFDYFKESGNYGLGMVITSISHWGPLHVGANVNFSINSGLVDNSGCIIDFGPSARVDITKDVFINIPFNAVCYVTFPKGSTDTETSWGAKISPSIHAFITDRLGLFLGPQMVMGFKSGEKTTFGGQFGISYSF